MDILPAIDLREGKCVRLLQGDYDRQIDYRDDPVAQAQEFEQAGAKWLHVVDLDGARHGGHYNIKVLDAIRKSTTLNIEVGGGIRTEASVKALLQTGIARVIIGSMAYKEPERFKNIVRANQEMIVLGLDARDGRVAIHGWTEDSDLTTGEWMTDSNSMDGEHSWLQEIVKDLAAIVYTDIARDGMLTGPDIVGTQQLAQWLLSINCMVPVIASGGVGSLSDIEQLAPLPIAGIIVGRALYEGKFTLRDALAVLAG